MKTERETQTELILKDLKKGRKPTPMMAYAKHQITCLAERIRDLREAGYKIRTDMITKNNKRFAQYTLIK